jgi:hypothetical protein
MSMPFGGRGAIPFPFARFRISFPSNSAGLRPRFVPSGPCTSRVSLHSPSAAPLDFWDPSSSDGSSTAFFRSATLGCSFLPLLFSF